MGRLLQSKLRLILNNVRRTTIDSNRLPFVVKCGKHKLYGYQNIVIFVLYVINRGCDV
jgi:hypothetical protein